VRISWRPHRRLSPKWTAVPMLVSALLVIQSCGGGDTEDQIAALERQIETLQEEIERASNPTAPTTTATSTIPPSTTTTEDLVALAAELCAEYLTEAIAVFLSAENITSYRGALVDEFNADPSRSESLAAEAISLRNQTSALLGRLESLTTTGEGPEQLAEWEAATGHALRAMGREMDYLALFLSNGTMGADGGPGSFVTSFGCFGDCAIGEAIRAFDEWQYLLDGQFNPEGDDLFEIPWVLENEDGTTRFTMLGAAGNPGSAADICSVS